MTSDFNPRNQTGLAGSTSSPGTPSDITAGGTRSGFTGTSTTTASTSSANLSRASDAVEDDGDRLHHAAKREAASVKEHATAAAGAVKGAAEGLASKAKSRIEDGAEVGKEQVTSGIGDFAAAIRKASDELGQRDQSMAANVVREVANGLEQASNSIKGASVQDLTRSVADFARRQPTAFMIGAVLAGVALGRFARASGEHSSGSPAGGMQGRSYAGEAAGVSHRGPAGDYSASYVNQPSPTRGAYPTGLREPLASPTDAAMGKGSGSFNPVGDDNVR